MSWGWLCRFLGHIPRVVYKEGGRLVFACSRCSVHEILDLKVR